MSPIKLSRVVGIALFLMSCSSFKLAEHPGNLFIKKQRRAKEAACAVKPFTYTPNNTGQKGNEGWDLARWQEILTGGLSQSNIFVDVVGQKSDHIPENVAYFVEGKVTRFYFKKNWVPTFFPFHLGASLFTATLYTWLAGPTTITMVDFEIQAELKDAKSGTLIKSFTERFKDTTPLSIYSKGVNNPYENPNLAFSKVIDSLAIGIAAALP